MLGVANGAYPTDAALRGVTDMKPRHEMMFESIDLMRKVWKGEPFQEQGKYWKAGYPEADPTHPFRDTRPWGGDMPMAMTGLSSPSVLRLPLPASTASFPPRSMPAMPSCAAILKPMPRRWRKTAGWRTDQCTAWCAM